MLIPPKYFLTPTISQYVASIEASREIINSIPIPPEIETNIRRKSTLKSSLFSARIEGNTLTFDEVQTRSTKDQKKIEVFNILKVLELIFKRGTKNVTAAEILHIHTIALHTIVDKQDLGVFRNHAEAIFNSAGMVVYMPPPARQVPQLINRLLKFINGPKETLIPIKACLAHYTFEKIHPFVDGSGRVGRLVLQLILKKYGYGMKGLLTLEEYLDQHRTLYYHALEAAEKDVTDYLEFMLEALAKSAENVKKEVLEKQKADTLDFLLPRRAEIFNIIKDQGMVNFDMIRRRFLAVNERTLRFDLKKLQELGLIKKRGATKGVYYQLSHSHLEGGLD